MGEKPDWIADNPVEVDIQSLYSFAQVVQRELDTNVKPNVQVIMERLGNGHDKTFGMDGRYGQGQVIGNYHQDCQQKAQELLDLFQRGMQAIAYAAQSIAQEYTSTDELNAMDLNKIGTYFNPKDKSRSMTERFNLPEVEPDNPPAVGPGNNRAI